MSDEHRRKNHQEQSGIAELSEMLGSVSDDRSAQRLATILARVISGEMIMGGLENA